MNNLEIFENPEFGTLRTVTVAGEMYFIGKDVAAVLGYADTFGALKKHVDEEDKQNCQDDSFESPRGLTVINESGLYSLILSSKMPKAKEFKRWITHEVIPSIRIHGAYMNDDVLKQAIQSPEFLIELATRLKMEKEARLQAEETIEANKPKVLFADAVSTSHTSILIGDLAKLLKQNGYSTGQKRLFNQLREDGFLIKSGNSKNMPTQRAMELKLFEVKESSIQNPDGSVRVTRTTKVTGKGQQYFINKYLGWKDSEVIKGGEKV